MRNYEYFVDENTGMACVIDTTYSFQDESDLLEYAEVNGWCVERVDAPEYAYTEDGEFREDMNVW